MRNVLFPALLVALCTISPAHAGESFDNCSGFIDSVPATITTQGVWCLRSDLSTAIADGYAITINANNVTIDCNHFKLGGLGAGSASLARGIFSDRMNTTVRNCSIRGFAWGVSIFSAGGNLVEGNRFDGNLYIGIHLAGAGSIARDNQVFDSGGSSLGLNQGYGIFVQNGVDVVGNTVFGVATPGDNTANYGIYTAFNGIGTIRDNRIKRVVSNGPSSPARAIFNSSSGRTMVRGNDIQGSGYPNSFAINCSNNQGTAYDNAISGFTNGITNCATNSNFINNN